MEEKANKKQLYALLGKNISYSFSKNYFSEKFKQEKIDNCEYVNFDITNIDLLPFILEANPNLKGMNVTIPYKEKIIPFLNEIDPIAQEIGAVNTISIDENKKLKGYNTDHYGFWNSIKKHLNHTHKHALILGTGGASKAIAYALKQAQIEYKFVSRSPKTEEIHYEKLTKSIFEKYNIIINCTPLGTYPNIEDYPKIPYEFLTKNHILFDLIYNPKCSKFLQKGKKMGAKTINGEEMLILQAEKSWKIWNNSQN